MALKYTNCPELFGDRCFIAQSMKEYGPFSTSASLLAAKGWQWFKKDVHCFSRKDSMKMVRNLEILTDERFGFMKSSRLRFNRKTEFKSGTSQH